MSRCQSDRQDVAGNFGLDVAKASIKPGPYRRRFMDLWDHINNFDKSVTWSFDSGSGRRDVFNDFLREFSRLTMDCYLKGNVESAAHLAVEDSVNLKEATFTVDPKDIAAAWNQALKYCSPLTPTSKTSIFR